VLWYKDKMCLGKDWFSRFLKNRDTALRKPEGLSRAIAQGLNHRVADNCFDLYGISLTATKRTLFSVWMRWRPFNNVPPKIVNRKGFRDVMKLTSAERSEKVITVA